MKVINNISETLNDELTNEIKNGDKLSIAAAYFSIYAFSSLKEQLTGLKEFRFLFTSPSFLELDDEEDCNGDDWLCGTQFETKFKNELTQKAVAREFANWAKKDSVQFRANKTDDYISGFAILQSSGINNETAYAPIQGFTTVDLGNTQGNGIGNIIQVIDAPFSKQYLSLFDELWKDKRRVVDIKETLLKRISEIYSDNAPEYVYYVVLNHIFSQFLTEISDEDFFANERVGFKGSVIWNKLYDFQKDAALAIINKLERYNGCILADSVGLGKTYTALAVIKYYELRNKNILVLCPKKLSANWNTFRGNFINNPLINDRFRYDVLYHTDLSRAGVNAESNGIKLGQLNWGNYDLLIIDESHNFRNGGSSNSEKQNRYQTLLEKVIRSGVKTKVLMLSATPVNNRFNDLRNQLQLAYEGEDSSILENKLNVKNTIDGIFKKAQSTFNRWSEYSPAYRTTKQLLKELDYDFFELLDSVTIARSRKQVKQYYDINSIGPFPERLSPKSFSPQLTLMDGMLDYDEIFNTLLSLNLSIYTPSHYIKPEKRKLYAEQFGDKESNKAFSQENREQGLRRLMAINLMKRLESSIRSFSLSVNRIYNLISNTIKRIEEYQTNDNSYFLEENPVEIYDDDEFFNDYYSTGKKVKINFRDMRLDEWKATLIDDRGIFFELQKAIRPITQENDNKLQVLLNVVAEKVAHPINNNNKKILIFTAFADTAEYLYECVSAFAIKRGLNVGLVTGTIDGRTTIPGFHCDYNTILTCFSPISKERDSIIKTGIESTSSIDILIGTDCISEGQNLQDCDYCINYDIHWNPVRIIQRYGRIDRIGSRNSRIQLVNFWPDVSLDEYINLKQKIETRMKIVNITATPEECILSNEEKIDLEYRKNQLEKLKRENVDIEDISTSISITDLGLNDFKLDLLDYTKNNKCNYLLRKGIHSVVSSTNTCPPGLILLLKNISSKTKIKTQNRLHPFYLVYIDENGEILKNHLESKEILSQIKLLCKGKNEADEIAYTKFNLETNFDADMSKYASLLQKAVSSIVTVKQEENINFLFKSGGTNFSKTEQIEGLNDFELICFLVVK